MNAFDAQQTLCHYLSSRATVAEPEELPATEPHWTELLETSGRALLTPALYSALRRKNLLDQAPGDVAEYLLAVYELSVRRNLKLKKQLLKVVIEFNRHGIVPLILKGAIALVDDKPYCDIGVRMMRDLDILVAQEQLSQCVDLLSSMNFRFVDEQADWQTAHHVQPMYHKDSQAVIELHRQIAPGEYARLLPAEALRRDANPHRVGGAELYLPSADHRVIHNILHSHIVNQDFRMGRVDLGNLCELARLCDSFEPLLNWQQIAVAFDARQYRLAFRNYFESLNELFCYPIPEALTDILAAASGSSAAEFVRLGSELRTSASNLVEKPQNTLKLFSPDWLKYKFRHLQHLYRVSKR